MAPTTSDPAPPKPPSAKIDPTSSPIPSTSDKRGKRPPRGKAPNRDVQISKALSKLLRHDAEKYKLKLDDEGFAPLDKVLQISIIKSLQCTIEDIHHSVADNAKQRFSMRPSPSAPAEGPNQSDSTHFLIRANQGHSIPLSSEALLTRLTLETVPKTVVHGTYHALYAPILAAGGLKAMSRNHIHFSKGLPEDTAADVISGMRNDAELLFYIDVQKSMDDGIEWWISDNGVVLTEGDKEGKIAPKYWKKVVGRKGGVGTLWEDGVEVAKMPEGVRGKKVPIGKAAHVKAKGRRDSREKGHEVDKEKKQHHRGGKRGTKDETPAASMNPVEQGKIKEAVKELEATASIDPPLVVETVISPDEKH